MPLDAGVYYFVAAWLCDEGTESLFCVQNLRQHWQVHMAGNLPFCSLVPQGESRPTQAGTINPCW